MREIKFRGLLLNKKDWVYGDLVHKAFDGYRTFDIGIKIPNCFADEVISKTVGQHSGFKDWYEGDIIQYPNKDVIGLICFGFYEYDNGADVYICGNGFYVQSETHNFIEPLFSVGFDRCNVIGNIHQNPELLT